MILVNQNAEYLHQESGVEGIYKQIETCARTCYKSLDKQDGTFEGSKKFVDRMIASHHTAMLESCSVYLKCKRNFYYYNNIDLEEEDNPLTKYLTNEYTKCNLDDQYLYVTTNLRVLVDNGWMDDLKYVVDQEPLHEKRYTFRIVTDRAVANEIVRHRKFSFAQESTRFCAYDKEKFGGDIAYILPEWFEDANVQQQEAFMQIMKDTEDFYFALRGAWDERKPDKRFKTGFKDNPLKPEQARCVLPLDLKTELCITGYASDWRFFLDLRLFGKTGKPHPQIKKLCELIEEDMKKNGIYDDIMSHDSVFSN